MKRWFTTVICILAALHLAGGPWGLLQVVAWTQMLADYSREKGLVQAVKETFDGEHPCAMCLRLDEKRQNEEKGDPLRQYQMEKSFQMVAAATTTDVPNNFPTAESLTPNYGVRPGSETQWMTRPPTPPPRAQMAALILA